VVLAVVVVQFFVNYVLTQRSSGRFQTEHKLQRDCNNKSKQEKSQDKKKRTAIQLNVKVKYKESKKTVHRCNKYIVIHVMNIEQILQYHSYMNVYKWKEVGL